MKLSKLRLLGFKSFVEPTDFHIEHGLTGVVGPNGCGKTIQAKPEQRRRVLEEAAGVAGLHARRHEAELRLKAAETNLGRLEDVIGQLAQQMDALKRQARQAIRF